MTTYVLVLFSAAPNREPLLTCNNTVDLVFMVDASAAVDYRDFRSVIEFIGDVCLLLSIDSGLVRVGLMTYADQPQPVFQLNTFRLTTDLRSAAANATYAAGSGANNASGALEYLRTTMFSPSNGDRSGVPNVAVMLTGSRSSSAVMTQRQADLTRRAGISVVVVVLSTWLDLDEVNNIASYPTNKTVLQTTYSTVTGIRQPLVNLICQSK